MIEAEWLGVVFAGGVLFGVLMMVSISRFVQSPAEMVCREFNMKGRVPSPPTRVNGISWDEAAEHYIVYGTGEAARREQERESWNGAVDSKKAERKLRRSKT